MKKQKVLIVHNYYQVPGGEDTVVENEKNLLLENNHEVIMYTRHNDEIKKKGVLCKLILPLETIFSFKTYREVKTIIKNENIDIVHVHNTLPLVSPSVYYAAIHSKIPVVQTVHNFRLLCPGATFTKNNKICEQCIEKNLLCSIKNRCYRDSLIQSIISASNLKFHRLIGTYKKVNGYIALTEFNKNKLSKLIDFNKIFIKPNFIDFSNVTDNSYNNKNYFIYVGRIDKLKGIDILLKAWKELKNETLYIVGTGPYEEKAKQYINKNNMQNVKMLGFKGKEEVIYLLSRAKALILPTQCYEGIPMTVVESFALGIPVVASNIGNLSTIVENNKNGLHFIYDEYKDLIRAITIFNRENLIIKLSKGAKKSFDEKYNKEISYKKLVEIYSCVG